MNKQVKKLGIGLLIIIGLVVVAAFIIGAFFQNAVGKKVISELNKQLKTEVKVKDFSLSLLRSFPDATVSLKDVTVMGLDKEALLEAKDMSFKFGLLSLFGASVKIHTVGINDGALNVHIDKKGLANYDIFKPSDGGTSEFNISLEKALLENIELAYRDEKLKQETMLLVEEAEFSGQFSNDKYDLKSTAKLTSNFLDLDKVRYFAGKKISYDAIVSVDLLVGKYTFKETSVTLEENTFKLDGFLQSQKTYSDFDITATTDEASIASVIALMPAEYLETFGDFSSTGKFQFGASVKGKLSAAERPAINLEFSLEDGKLTSPRLKEPFKDVSFQAVFTNGSRNSRRDVFEIKDFKGYLDRQLITMSLLMENLSDPKITFSTDGALPIGYIYGLFNNPAITGGDGKIEFRNLKVDGYYRDMVSTQNVMAVAMSGDLDFDDAELTVNGEDMIFDRGKMRFDNNTVTLDGLKLTGAGSEINLKGSLQNLLPVLFADSLNSKNASLDFQAEFYSPKMDLARLVKLSDVPVQENEVEAAVFDSLKVASNEDHQRLTDLLKGTFTAKVDEFSYNKIEGGNFTGKLVFENSKMQLEGRTNGMKGAFLLDGTMFFEKSPRLEAKLDCQKVDVNEFFEQTNNAGQTVLKAENLEGRMNAKMLIHAFWDSIGNLDMNRLHVWAGIGIENGRLKNFSMLEEFSTYAKMDDLRDVRFVNLQNWLEIKNNIFYLPAMFIQNNAMNLTVAGAQNFDDRIDYNLKVNAGQVIANKFKKKNSDLDPIPAKDNGFFNLYFSITGTLDQYKYETNKKKVKDAISKSERQKQEIKRALIAAFGAPLNMLREPEGWQDEGEAASTADDDLDYIPGF